MVLMLLNLTIAMASGSLAVTAEMVNKGVDLFSSVAVLVGLKLSSRKTQAFPYGMYKLENMFRDAGVEMELSQAETLP